MVPDEVGVVHTLNSSSVLTVSGDKGFAIFDKDFQCIFVDTLIVEKFGEVIFADMHNDQLTFVYGNENKRIFSTKHTGPRNDRGTV